MSHKIKVLAPIALALGVSGALFGLGPAGSGEQVAKADVCVLEGLVEVQAPGNDVNVGCPPHVGGYLYGNGGWYNHDDGYWSGHGDGCYDRCGDWDWPSWWHRQQGIAIASAEWGQGRPFDDGSGTTWFDDRGINPDWFLASWRGTVYWVCP